MLETNIAAFDLRNVTAWALTDIDTKFGEKIKFSYKNKAISSKYKKRVSIDIVEPLANSSLLWEHSIDDEVKSSNYSVFTLASIKTANERIEFVDSSTGNQIHQINITDSLTNALVKRIEFYYHSLSSGMHPYFFLDSVKIFDKDLIAFQKYSFDYYDADDYPSGMLTYLLPDQWGYNKVAYEGYTFKVLHNELGNDHARRSGFEYSTKRIAERLNQIYPGYLGNRKENLTPELLSLRSIAYPTGGYTVYEYEPNKNSASQYLGGIRIKSISHFEKKVNQHGFPVLKLKRDYTYGGGSSGSSLGHNEFRKEHMVFQELPSGSTAARRGVTYSSDYFGDRTDLENATYYSQVTETISSNQGYNGKIAYQYANIHNTAQLHPFYISINDDNGIFSHYLGGPTYILRYAHWKKPVLSNKKIYSKEKLGFPTFQKLLMATSLK